MSEFVPDTVSENVMVGIPRCEVICFSSGFGGVLRFCVVSWSLLAFYGFSGHQRSFGEVVLSNESGQ